MSLILEALRKSEAERRRGEMPDLRAELPPAPARVATTTPGSWRIGLAVAALLALAAWWATSARQPQPAAVAPPPPRLAAPGPTLPRVAHLQPMAPRVPASKDGGLATTQATVAAPRRPDPAPPGNTVAAVRDPGTSTTAATPAAPTPAAHASIHTAAPAAPAAGSAPAGASGDAPLPVADLAPEERKALPPLRLSMHLWNDDPSRRFVILDGNRLGEGDRSGNLVVTAILRDGVLLDWNGRTIKVPLR